MTETFRERVRRWREELRQEKVPLNPFALARKLWQIVLRSHTSPGKLAWAIGVGVFIGCLPIFGFHLLLCVVTGLALRLNILVSWLAANISNPFFAPFLVFAEIQVGYLLLHGRPSMLTMEELRAMGVPAVVESFFVAAFVGSLVVGLALGLGFGGFAYLGLKLRRDRKDRQQGQEQSGRASELED